MPRVKRSAGRDVRRCVRGLADRAVLAQQRIHLAGEKRGEALHPPASQLHPFAVGAGQHDDAVRQRGAYQLRLLTIRITSASSLQNTGDDRERRRSEVATCTTPAASSSTPRAARHVARFAPAAARADHAGRSAAPRATPSQSPAMRLQRGVERVGRSRCERAVRVMPVRQNGTGRVEREARRWVLPQSRAITAAAATGAAVTSCQRPAAESSLARASTQRSPAACSRASRTVRESSDNP